MCTCASCEYTDRLAGLPDLFGFVDVPYLMPGRTERALPSFHAWPCDKPKGPRASAAEYRAHVSHLWEGVNRGVMRFKPGQPAQYPAVPGMVHPVAPMPASWYAWNSNAVKYVPPVEKPSKPQLPYLVALARELRKAA